MADTKIGGDIKGALALALLLTLGAIAVGDTTLGMLVTAIVTFILIYVMARLPIRVSMLALMFLAFTLENPPDNPACNLWKTPFFIVGALMLTHWNNVSGISWMSFSGMDICLGSLLLIAFFRRMTGSKIDRMGRIETPKPLVQLALLSLGGMMYAWLNGIARGGNFAMSLWQIDRTVYLPVVFLLFQMGLRGPKDHAALARVVLVAATYKAIVATYVIHTVQGPLDPETGSTRLPYGTTHHDSMLFAIAFVLLLAFLMERAGRSTRRLAFLLLPIIVLGIVSNGRRMAWVQVALVFLTVYMVTPDNPVKKKLRRALYALVPVATVYCAVGWQSDARIFKPVQMIRSVVDAKTDLSTLWREVENFDIISTIRMNPIFGTGYGNGFQEFVELPAVGYPLERYLPHNSILGLWCSSGYIGYTAMTMLWAMGVYFGMRAYHASKTPAHRVAAVVSFGAVLVYMVQCWGDVGLGSWIGVYIVAPAIAVAGKLAVFNGQWGSKKSKTGTTRTRRMPSMPDAEQAA